MDRRRFLAAGSGLATFAGASTLAAAPAAAAEVAKHTPSVFDFGAVGDGRTDDSGAFSKALQHAAADGVMVIVPAGTYAVAKTVTYKSEGNVGHGWGLICQGATLLSQIDGEADVVRLSSSHTVRYFKLIGSLSIVGNGRDGNGIHIEALGNPQSFYNFLIDGLSVERCGGHGGLIEGNVFECTIANSYFQDMRRNGFTLAHSHKGVVSTVNIMNCFFNQNGQYGLATTNFDEKYGGPTDVRVYGGYARDNAGFGFYYNNGTRQASLIQVGFENNCRSKKPGDPEGAHVYGLGSMRMKDCAGYNQNGGATYLLRGWLQGLTHLDGCSQGADAAMASTGKSRLVQINGPRGSHVYMVGCAGGVDVVAGAGVTWEAKNCIGPSPAGDLQMAGTLNGTA
jgi:Pectate lyase superfamily protein